MERLTGGTVAQQARVKGFTQPGSVAICLAAAAGLHFAHQRGVLHRDVKPENLMFSSAGAVKVTDFGIAKVIGGATTMATRAGYVMGTPAYIAPEQAQAKALSPATDVYAAGTVLYELLAGRLPFSEEGDPVAMLYRHVHENPEPLAAANPDVPKELAAVVDRSLARDPGGRYASAEEFGMAIARAAASSWGRGWLDASGISVGAARSILAEAAGAREPAADAVATASAGSAGRRTTVLTRRQTRRATRRSWPESSVEILPTDLVSADALVAAHVTSSRTAAWRLAGAATALALVVLTIALVIANSARGHGVQAGQGAIVFSDGFTDPNSGWGTLDSPVELARYTADRHYRIEARVPQQVVFVDSAFSGGAVHPQLTDLGNVSIEAEARELSGGHGVFGLLCRGRGVGQPYYLGAVDVHGSWWLYRYNYNQQGQGVATLLSQGAIPSLSTPAGAQNPAIHLRLDCAGPAASTVTLRLYEKGQLLGQAEDANGLPPGRVGMLVDSEAAGDLAVDFGSFTVRQLSTAHR
jgi:hypothetical protein